MIYDYEIISEHDLVELKTKVNDMLNQGWQPYGDLQISTPVINYVVAPLYTQVLVKMHD